MNPQTPKRVESPSAETRIAGDFSLRYLFEVFFRRKRMLFTTLVFTAGMTILISLFIRPRYMSTTTMLLSKDEILNPLVRFDMAVTMTDYNRLDAFQKVIYSRPLIEDTIHQLGLDREIKSDADMENMVKRIRDDTHVIELAADSFQIGCSASNPYLAKNMVETISRLFVEKSLQSSRREALAAVNFLQKEVDRYQEDVARVDTQLQEFRKNNAEMLHTAGAFGNEINECRAQRQAAELELKEQQLYERLYGERLSGEKPMVITSALYVQNTPYQVRYQELQLQMGNLLATREKTHPEVVKLQREMDYINDLLRAEKEKKEAKETQEVRSPEYQETLARLDDAKIKSRVLEQKIQELQHLQDTLMQKIDKEPELVKEQNRLEDDVKQTRDIYDNLRLKLEQARVTSEVELEQQASRFLIIEPPRISLSHYKPKYGIYAFAGIMGGLVLGFVLALLLEFMDPALIRPGDLVRRAGMPLIGVLPKLFCDSRKIAWYIPSWTHRLLAKTQLLLDRISAKWGIHTENWIPQASCFIDRALYRAFGARRFELPETVSRNLLLNPARLKDVGMSDDPRELALDDYIERLRHVGIAIRAAYDTPEHLVCLIASVMNGEGKTVMTANLGTVLASDLKQPILLLDACQESPDLSALFGHGEASGLGDVLDGRVSLDDALIDTGMPNLWLLPAGKTSEYADVIFNGPAFRQTLEMLRERFAWVLIETQGLGMQADGLLIAPHTDGVLILSRLYHTKKGAILNMVNRLPKDKIIGFITNYGEYWIPEWAYKWV